MIHSEDSVPPSAPSVRAVPGSPGSWLLHWLRRPDVSKHLVEQAEQEAGRHLAGWAGQSIDEVRAQLGGSAEPLSDIEAAERLSRYGPNQIAQEKSPAWYLQLLRAFINPFNAILVLLGTVSLVMDVIVAAPQDRTWKTVITMSVMVLVAVALRFSQEFRSNRAAEKLKALVHTTATVIRRLTDPQAAGGAMTPQQVERPMSCLVPGDLVHLSAGDMVPADVRLVRAKDLMISQAMLTGEAMPVEKTVPEGAAHGAGASPHSDIPADDRSGPVSPGGVPGATSGPATAISVFDLPTICFMGTSVISGSAVGLVVATGSHTYFGVMAKTLVGQHVETSFEKGVNRVSWVLIRFMMVMVPIVFLLNGFIKGAWLDAFMFSVAVAVGLIPEMLPMIVSTNLAKGAIVMARRKCVVKRINAIQNIGAMDVLCTDKTGTLTQDQIILERYLDAEGIEDEAVLSYAYLNSAYQTGLKNLMDVAVIRRAKAILAGRQDLKDQLKVDEVPFDFQRRRMSVVLSRPGSAGHQMICKGAVEEMLAICTRMLKGGHPVAIDDAERERIRAHVASLNEDGMRALLVAYRDIMPTQSQYGKSDERDLILVGYIGFLDPPKDSVKPALHALRVLGIQVKVITGDSDIVTRRVCSQVGLEIGGVLLGADIERLTDADLANRVEATTIFARQSPAQKSRIIRALKSHGHTVGFLGDGINDAAALREADVGISVDTAVDIAKESADIILLEKDLVVLQQGVEIGRTIFGNIIKYIKMTASSNFGNVFSILVASAFLPFLPMLAVQLLIQNLLYDFSQISIPWDRVDEDYLRVPRKWDASSITKFMIFIGPLSSIFDITTFCVMWFVFGANSPEKQALFQSGWFVEGLLSQTLIVHMIRTQKIPFVTSSATLPVLLLTGTIMAVGIAIPFTPLAGAIGLQALPASYFAWLAATLLGYCVLTQVVKAWYIRIYKVWL